MKLTFQNNKNIELNKREWQKRIFRKKKDEMKSKTHEENELNKKERD